MLDMRDRERYLDSDRGMGETSLLMLDRDLGRYIDSDRGMGEREIHR